VDFLLHALHQFLEPLGGRTVGRAVFGLDVIDGETDEVQRVPDLVRDAPGQLSDGGQMLGLPEPLFDPLVLAEALDHEVEALVQVPDLVLAVHGKALVEIPGGHLPCRRDDVVNGFGVPHGEKRGEQDPDGENSQGGQDALRRVATQRFLQVLDVDLQVDVPIMRLAGDDGDDDVVGLAFLVDGRFPELGLDDQFLFPLAHRRADLVGVGAGDDLVGIADDGDLLDPLGLQRGQVLLQACLARGPPRDLLDTHLHRLGQFGGLALDLGHQVPLGLPVDGDQGDQQGRGHEEHHQDELLVEGEIEENVLEHTSVSAVLAPCAPVSEAVPGVAAGFTLSIKALRLSTSPPCGPRPFGDSAVAFSPSASYNESPLRATFPDLEKMA